ncbi:hypothetical protein [Vaginisenegalia massiliensis]|uniref:hypothetical protein n=1 Tax=Vaginisenegalia massiliensis TaxID=2058294 RepID=UPI000F53A779|nr:hypothetical protein [Vaginisenegalia massiliensis]
MDREQTLKTEIETKFGNVKAFSDNIKVPYTTVRTILERGVGNARLDNIFKICDGLDFSISHLNPAFRTETRELNLNLSRIFETLNSDQQADVLNYASQLLAKQSVVNQTTEVELTENLTETTKKKKKKKK